VTIFCSVGWLGPSYFLVELGLALDGSEASLKLNFGLFWWL